MGSVTNHQDQSITFVNLSNVKITNKITGENKISFFIFLYFDTKIIKKMI